MGGAWIGVIVLLVALFWALGAYNRLTRLRARAWLTLDQVLESWTAQANLLSERLAPYEPQADSSAWVAVHDETLQWRALAAAARQLATCCKALAIGGGKLPDRDALASVWEARAVFDSHWQRLKEAHADLAGAAIPADLQTMWSQHELLAGERVAACQQALAAYHGAIHQFPASVLARFFKFEDLDAPATP